jgi:hypothetical protein
MSEAEVSLRLALWLIAQNRVVGDVSVAIDGAQVRIGDTIHFPVAAFLTSLGWLGSEAEQWQGCYRCRDITSRIVVHSKSGVGDVVAELSTGQRFRVECKKGPLVASASSSEYVLLRAALGHVVTSEELQETDILAVAVPNSERFRALSSRWRKAPLVQKCGIRILLVDSNGVHGFDA